MSDFVYIALLLVLMVLSAIASSAVTRKFNKYAQVRAACGMSADRVAQQLLTTHGSGVTLQQVSGSLTDHYNPSAGTVGLSQAVYGSTSVSALAVAAHEIGHVLQYQEGYGLIKLRNAILPTANIGSMFAPYIVIFGLLLGSYPLALVGVCLYAVMLLFQVATLPVEFDASHRGMEMLLGGGYISADQESMAREVLRAAAMTYVYSALATLVSFLRLLNIATRARRRN